MPLPEGVTLRPATTSDIAGLVAVHLASREVAYRDHISPAYLAAVPVTERRARWERQLSGDDASAVTWLAERDDRVVGFCHASRTYAPTDAPHVHSLYLLPEAQRGGIGRALLETTGQSLADLGFGRVTLHVYHFNAPAIAFYERLGWVWQETTPVEDAGDPPFSVHRYGMDLQPRDPVQPTEDALPATGNAGASRPTPGTD